VPAIHACLAPARAGPGARPFGAADPAHARAQDFFQLLRPGLQLLRPPKKSSAGQATVGGLVPYNADAFVAEFGVQPSQARRPALLCAMGRAGRPGGSQWACATGNPRPVPRPLCYF
jgi:hypothetical protein